MPDLWLYNLHYFDDLNASEAKIRAEWHNAWIDSWVVGNPVGAGRGWDAYPTSLRIVNWIRWALRGERLSESAVGSLALQARWLERRLETHLLGNHLWSNAKALCFAGAFFEGSDAVRWLQTGLRTLEEELREQLLSDGGHFERSPMYHGLFLEDVLDLIQLVRLRPAAFPTTWSTTLAESAKRMLEWMGLMVHPDGGISFFNDSTFGICPPYSELVAYAALLDIPTNAARCRSDGLVHLAPSGFLRMQGAGATLLADVGSVGPDHLPGHAHAETLCFELSIHGERAVVNGGVSVYGNGPERQRQRGSQAHSTLVVDGADSSEVWAGFRVARRARVVSVAADAASGEIWFRAAHDGYRRLPGSPLHRRTWVLGERALAVEDEVTGAGLHRIEILLHLAPWWRAEVADEGVIRLTRNDWLAGKGCQIVVSFQRPFDAVIKESFWHPGFGISQSSASITLSAMLELPMRHMIRIDWSSAECEF